MGRRGRRSSAEWARLVDEFRDTGLTQAEFAQARGLNVGTFRQRLYTRRAGAGAGTGGGVLGAGRFVEVSVAQTPTVVGMGCRVRVSAAYLSCIVRSLDTPPRGRSVERLD
jgi:hypothetical protein